VSAKRESFSSNPFVFLAPKEQLGNGCGRSRKKFRESHEKIKIEQQESYAR